jgi:hypothetical protein
LYGISDEDFKLRYTYLALVSDHNLDSELSYYLELNPNYISFTRSIIPIIEEYYRFYLPKENITSEQIEYESIFVADELLSKIERYIIYLFLQDDLRAVRKKTCQDWCSTHDLKQVLAKLRMALYQDH